MNKPSTPLPLPENYRLLTAQEPLRSHDLAWDALSKQWIAPQPSLLGFKAWLFTGPVARPVSGAALTPAPAPSKEARPHRRKRDAAKPFYRVWKAKPSS